MSLLDDVQGPFHDRWETARPSERESAIRRNLDDYVRLARGVPFYRERLEGYAPGEEHPLKSVPVLNSNQLRELLPPKSTALLASGAAYNVFQSGGTTGFPKTT